MEGKAEMGPIRTWLGVEWAGVCRDVGTDSDATIVLLNVVALCRRGCLTRLAADRPATPPPVKGPDLQSKYRVKLIG
jgi:hypothetical protein